MATDFFRQQDLARRNTRILILLFGLAVLSLIVLTNLLVMLSFGLLEQPDTVFVSWETISIISLSVIAAVALAIAVKWQQLKLGGRSIAQALNGEFVAPDSQEPLKRRLLNIVEEMALAANLPVPPVYLLPEAGINAFAAGYSPADAVIGVTQGCLEQLNRDELQGVIAHEFSHILNGDMRMNIRLIAILNGILFIGHIGYYLLRASRSNRVAVSNRNRNQGAAAIMGLGIGLVMIGYLGSFFGNLIKAAVSRQREYLADASAVQFSRNPQGIAGALKRIGGYQAGSHITHANADEVSHLFFGAAISRWAAIFATHPPLEKRIRRVDPSWDGRFIAATQASPKPDNKQKQPQHKALYAAIPLLLTQSSHQPLSAQAIVCAVLFATASNPQNAVGQSSYSLQELTKHASSTLVAQVQQVADAVYTLPLAQQVKLLQMSAPALKQLSATEIEQFVQLLQTLAGPTPALLPWLCLRFIEHVVASQHDAKHIVSRYHQKKLPELLPQLLPLLSAIADCAGSPTSVQNAWLAAIQQLQLAPNHAKPAVTTKQLDQALIPLLQAAPGVKAQLWQAILASVHADQQFTDQEQGLTNFLALLLEMPVPSKEEPIT